MPVTTTQTHTPSDFLRLILYSLRRLIIGMLRWYARGNDDESYDFILVCYLNVAQSCVNASRLDALHGGA